jgi:3-hydroxybutyryl-CoA dehydratase
MTVMSRKTYYFEDLELGMEASVAKTVAEADIIAFADITGDKNPVHLDETYASNTMFKSRIAHGMLTAGYVSAVFGMEMPGPGAIYISQTLNFRAPVRTKRPIRQPGGEASRVDVAPRRNAPSGMRRSPTRRRCG